MVENFTVFIICIGNFYAVILIMIPTHEYLMNIGAIPSNSSDNLFVKFGDKAPSYRIPSVVILNGG